MTRRKCDAVDKWGHLRITCDVVETRVVVYAVIADHVLKPRHTHSSACGSV